MSVRLVVAAAVLLTIRPAHAKRVGGDELVRFIRQACEVLDAHVGNAENARRLGRVRRQEMVTKHVSKPHLRYYFAPMLLPGWEAVADNGTEIQLDIAAHLAIRLADLERRLGPAQAPTEEMRLAPPDVGEQSSSTEIWDPDNPPTELEFSGLGPHQTCAVSVTLDGKKGDVHRQGVVSIQIDG